MIMSGRKVLLAYTVHVWTHSSLKRRVTANLRNTTQLCFGQCPNCCAFSQQTVGTGGSNTFEKRGGAEDNLSAPYSFIANAHNEMYTFYTEKAAFWKKYEPIVEGGGAPAVFSPLNPLPTVGAERYFGSVVLGPRVHLTPCLCACVPKKKRPKFPKMRSCKG